MMPRSRSMLVHGLSVILAAGVWQSANAEAQTVLSVGQGTVSQNVGGSISTGMVARSPVWSPDPTFGELIGFAQAIASPGPGQFIFGGGYEGSNSAGQFATLNVQVLGYEAPSVTGSLGTPTFAGIVAESQDIVELFLDNTVPGGHAIKGFYVDVTSFARDLPVHVSQAPYVSLGMAVRLSAGEPNNLRASIFSPYMHYRDGSAAAPFLPSRVDTDVFRFERLPAGFYDPPSASGFTYTMISDSLFTEAGQFPSGFSDAFYVTVGETVLGPFATGETADFSSFPGGGVPSFTVSGINPLVDPTDPLAFPLYLDFNTPTADFTMQAVPEPSCLGMALVGIVALTLQAVRRRTACALVCLLPRCAPGDLRSYTKDRRMRIC